jgi:hypothetical protein
LRLALRSRSTQAQHLLIDYAVRHVKAIGSTSAKVVKGGSLTLASGDDHLFARRHIVQQGRQMGLRIDQCDDPHVVAFGDHMTNLVLASVSEPRLPYCGYACGARDRTAGAVALDSTWFCTGPVRPLTGHGDRD